MGKAGRAKGSSTGGRNQPSTAWLCSGVVLALGLAGWASFQKAPTPKEVSEAEEEEDDDALGGRFETVREALFAPEGGSVFGPDSWKGTGGRSRFAEASYWDERYAKSNKDYDWYGTWNGASAVKIKNYVGPHLPQGSIAILNAGCGNSRLPAELVQDGYDNITSVDISSTVISKMQAKFANIPGLSFLFMDITALSFANNSFDVVLEKGTLDAMYTGASAKVKEAVAEFYRVLRPGGIFVSMTFGMPQSRADLNKTGVEEKMPWEEFHVIEVDRKDAAAQAFYIYIMKKHRIGKASEAGSVDG